MKNKKNIVIMLVVIIFITYILYFLNIIPHKKYTNKDFNIDTYISSVDNDNDGIDDQTDILKSTREYIASKPKYKSKYYATGYPDDEYGVCTDVVVFALLNAGYDLMNLVDEDIKNNRNDYDVDIVDKKIDFRRTQNLNIYFRHAAISLTTNINNIEQWQGGDIVVFKGHIAIVSDKRNKRGIPFIIHHEHPYQFRYEEDILEQRNDIIGHYRLS